MSKRNDYIKSCEISHSKTYNLNGYSQKIFFEGKYSTNPVIIYLHGGPGSPIPFCAGSRGMFPEITDHFIMVYWDQLGCGINDYMIDENFTINHYVSMTVDLIKAVHMDFPNNPINLFGVSWGSILAAKAAVQIPDLINHVTVYGQVTKNLFFNEEVFNKLESSYMNQKEKQQLDLAKANNVHSTTDIMLMTKLIRKYTEGYQAKNGGKTPMSKIIFGLLTSPDYSFKDFKAIVVNGTIKNQSLFKELTNIDLTNVIKEISIPYLILQGSTDIVTPTTFIQQIMGDAKNNNLQLIMVSDSGHMPSAKGMWVVIEKGFGSFK